MIHLIGHIELPSQDIATVMDGIAEAMTEEDEKKKYSNNATEGNPPHLRHLLLKRGEKALDDYPGGPEMMYKAYWPLMPLKRGFTPGKCIADSKWRQLFLYHDNRFSKNNTIIFHVANIIMRHAVNRSVHAGIMPLRPSLKHSRRSKKKWPHQHSKGNWKMHAQTQGVEKLGN